MCSMAYMVKYVVTSRDSSCRAPTAPSVYVLAACKSCVGYNERQREDLARASIRVMEIVLLGPVWLRTVLSACRCYGNATRSPLVGDTRVETGLSSFPTARGRGCQSTYSARLSAVFFPHFLLEPGAGGDIGCSTGRHPYFVLKTSRAPVRADPQAFFFFPHRN